MAATLSRRSESLENARNSWIPMPATSESSHDSGYELQALDVDDDVEINPSWRSLFAFARRKHTLSFILAVISSVVASLIRPTSAIFFGKFFSALTKYGAGIWTVHETLLEVSKWCAALAGIGAASWLTQGAFLSSWMIFGELQAKSAREQMFRGMLGKDMEWYDLRRDGVGSLLIRIETQIRELQLSASQPMGFLLLELSAATAALGLAFYYAWSLTLVIMSTFPIAAIALFLVSMKLGPAIESQKRELSLASKHANTAITAINTVKAFNGQDQEVWQYFSTIKKVAASYLTQARANSLQFGITKFVLVGIYVQGFWYGIALVNKGVDPGKILTTFYASLTAIQCLEIILPQWLVMKKGMSAGETLKMIRAQMEHEKASASVSGNLRPESCCGDIEVNGVSFAYPTNPRQEVLSNTTFFFPAGEMTFVVGKSGSGKSTLGNLLMKYYEPLRGEIIVDGHSIKALETDWIRQNITLVQQQSVLFNETLFQNIAFGRRGQATEEDVREAVRTADLEKTLLHLEQGLETGVGSNGKSLSGGEQQRVAIARARLRDAPILILDEATSALDKKSREEVMIEMRKWRKGKTTIIITHDVSQIQDDEYVYVLETGVVVQEGYRKKLVEKFHGTFASFLPGKRVSGEHDRLYVGRRESEPTSPTSPTSPEDVDEDDFQHRWGYISNIFEAKDSPALLSNNFSVLASHRMSLGIGAAHANALHTEAMWKRPLISAEETFQIPPTGRSPNPLVSPKPGTESRLPPFSETLQGSKETISGFNSPAYYERPTTPPPIQAKIPAINTSLQDHTVPPQIPQETKPELKSLPIKRQKIQEIKPASLKEILSTIWPTLAWRDRTALIVGFIAAAVVATATPMFGYVFAKLLSTFYITANRSAEARKWSLTLLGIALIDGTASYVTHYALEYSGEAWVNALRVEALKRILAQPRSWFDDESNSPGRLNQCLDRNAEEMRNLIGRFAGPIFTAFLMLAISIAWAFTISWKLTLVALASAPVMWAVTRAFDWVCSKWENNCNKASESTSSIFIETFSNIRVVRALTLEPYFTKKYAKATRDAYKIGLRRATYSGLLFGLSDTVGYSITALVFYYGTIIIRGGEISVATFFQLSNILLFGIANAGSMIAVVPQINTSRTTATQMLYLAHLALRSPEELKALGQRRVSTPFPIQFNDLSFTHPSTPDTKTLSNISLKIDAGSFIALVGPSGCGKSTIASILLGLYPPDEVPPHQSSSLTFDGTPIHECNISTLRTFMAIVPQAPHLFPATILANIIYGLPEGSPFATLNCTAQSCKDAGIHDFISSLDQGYYTLIGEGGMGLSGGQAQRIAIARALVRRPSVLVLDEATSALDAVSAEVVKDTIRRLMAGGRMERRREEGKGMAVVFISHNVEMMRIADEVVVIESGTVVEKGGFEELRGRGGTFSRLIGGIGVGEVERGDGKGLTDLMTPVRSRGREAWRKGSL